MHPKHIECKPSSTIHSTCKAAIKKDNLPFIAVKASTKIESCREQPRITVHSNQ